MKSEVLWSNKTKLKGEPPILADGDAAIDWAMLQEMDRGDAENLFNAVVTLRGGLWRTYFIREVGRLVG